MRKANDHDSKTSAAAIDAVDSSTIGASTHHPQPQPQQQQLQQGASSSSSSSVRAISDSSTAAETTTTTKTTNKTASPCKEKEDDVSKQQTNKARQFVERVLRLQIETCYGGGGNGIEVGEASVVARRQQNKEAFLHFVRILQAHLQLKDPAAHQKVQAALQTCAAKRQKAASQEAAVAAAASVMAGYETVAASMASTLICLQQIVRPVHWKRAVDYMKQQHANNSRNAVWSLVESIAMDDMIFFTQRLMEKQDEFKKAIFAATAATATPAAAIDPMHHPLYVDMGVHYTKYANLDRIQVNGLLSRSERGNIGITAERFNGDVHGNGIYTGNNPYAYSDFGDVGILVARLKGIASFRSKSGKGKVGDAAIATSSGSEPNENFYNSIVVGDGYSQMVVLGESSQCIPLLHFPRSMIDKHKANQSNDFSSSAAAAGAAGNGGCAILYYQEELQKIVDEFFNQGIVPPRSSTSKQQQQQPRPVASRQMDTTQATMTAASTMATTTIKTVVYQVVYMVAFMAIVGTIVSMSVSLCLFLVKTMSSLSSSRFIEL